MEIIIKRYQNRKLYNTQSKRYITLEEIEELIKNEQKIKVIDNSTGNDITAITLSQIIFEFEKNRSGFLPIKLLLSLVQSGGIRIDELRQNIINSLSGYRHYDSEIERRISLLISQGQLNEKEGIQMQEKLLSINQQIRDTQDEMDEVIIKQVNDQQLPTKKELKILIDKIDEISKRVDELQMEKGESKQ
jgi:polyhydroxyalkanoate synthesis repressor PhaR